ncbi:Farnesyl pyrophosphate synthetase [Pleurotus pulmonarius]|nr:Farnesyl pyrophosphate synthetase [Pleurotus pulmonarius]
MAYSTLSSPTPNDDQASRRDRFISMWDPIRDELVQYMEQQQLPKDACDWYRNVRIVALPSQRLRQFTFNVFDPLEPNYNVLGGKLNRGMSVIDSAEILLGRSLTDEEYGKAAVLGWCIELFQAFCLVSDDIMDKCLVRRTQPRWHRLPHVRLIAVNDACMLRSAIFYLLKRHFRQETYYAAVLELFHDVSFNTDIGQLVDLITASEVAVDLDKFSLERHRKIVVYKTAYYSFYLPVALAMRLTGIPDSNLATSIQPYRVALSILILLREYSQVQDDWLDYAGTVEQIGKVGTDIIDNKCSWCINTALALANAEQRAILDANYERAGTDAVFISL